MLVLEEEAEAERVIAPDLLAAVRLDAGSEAREPSAVGKAVLEVDFSAALRRFDRVLRS